MLLSISEGPSLSLITSLFLSASVLCRKDECKFHEATDLTVISVCKFFFFLVLSLFSLFLGLLVMME